MIELIHQVTFSVVVTAAFAIWATYGYMRLADNVPRPLITVSLFEDVAGKARRIFWAHLVGLSLLMCAVVLTVRSGTGLIWAGLITWASLLGICHAVVFSVFEWASGGIGKRCLVAAAWIIALILLGTAGLLDYHYWR